MTGRYLPRVDLLAQDRGEPTAAAHPGRRFSSAGYRIALYSFRYGRSAQYTSR